MTKQKLLLLFISVCTIWNSAKAQAYSIESFEGPKVKIHLTESLPGKSWYCAKVSCSTDSLFLADYNGVEEVRVLGHKFLEIVYSTRGGTGSLFRNTVILSVKKNKIHVAMLVDSFGEAFGGDTDGSIYKVKFNVIGINQSDFKLIAHIYDRQKSRSNPQKNYARNNSVTFNFDSGRNIFYNSYKNITQSFSVNNPKTQQSNQQQISGSFPTVALGDNYYYYYIKGEWYKGDYDHNLFQEYYR